MSGIFRWRGIDEETRSPFKPFSQSNSQSGFDMPVVFWPVESIPNRRGMKGKTVRGVREKFKKRIKQRLDPDGKVLHLFFSEAMKIRTVNLRDDPGFNGVA